MIIKILYAAAITESIVFCIFFAAPLLRPRLWLISKTPWLISNHRKQHLLECPVCTGFYVALVVWSTIFFYDAAGSEWLFGLILCYRLFTIVKDIYTAIFNLGLNLIVWRTKK